METGLDLKYQENKNVSMYLKNKRFYIMRTKCMQRSAVCMEVANRESCAQSESVWSELFPNVFQNSCFILAALKSVKNSQVEQI